MRALVTGSAGFIGTNLAHLLLDNGVEVVGVDSFTTYYDPDLKRHNGTSLTRRPGYELVLADLNTADLSGLLDGIDVVFHLAGQPGVRGSWAAGFADYLTLNVHATQRLLEAAKHAGTRRFVYASSSSVYGNATDYPCLETHPTEPFSPYGVTKLAGEHLVRLYAANFGLPTVSLRFFTVYGPRQRPEMAVARMIDAALTGGLFDLFAAQGAVRDFTYVGDVARATMLAGLTPALAPGLVLNVSGGTPCTMDDVIDTLADVLGGPVPVRRTPVVAGDVVRTGGSAELARAHLGWTPATSLREGLVAQVATRLDQLATLPQPHPQAQAQVLAPAGNIRVELRS